ncbi:hypothetical protein MTR67_021508 [Solanum verrucosum]|uniref:Uncharacterized protein n=1 Tax=Solanum verrucosum TaxID=315347 RepID=A0AAF0QRR0_SOLVR|nr:hypothetical protein MTR67_021508 [Solanum verrucosum]
MLPPKDSNIFHASKSFADTLKALGVKAECILYEGKTHTDLFLQDPMRGGIDDMLDDLITLIHGDSSETIRANSTPRKRLVPEFMLKMGRSVRLWLVLVVRGSPLQPFPKPSSENQLSIESRIDPRKSFADTLKALGVKAECILYEGKTHTNLFLQDPMRSGIDDMLDDLITLIHGDSSETIRANSTPRK